MIHDGKLQQDFLLHWHIRLLVAGVKASLPTLKTGCIIIDLDAQISCGLKPRPCRNMTCQWCPTNLISRLTSFTAAGLIGCVKMAACSSPWGRSIWDIFLFANRHCMKNASVTKKITDVIRSMLHRGTPDALKKDYYSAKKFIQRGAVSELLLHPGLNGPRGKPCWSICLQCLSLHSCQVESFTLCCSSVRCRLS